MTDDPKPTHVVLDGATHAIARVDEVPDGPGHTHRVFLACGMTIDVDIGGARAHARSMERLGHVQKEHDLALKALHVQAHTAAAAAALEGGERWSSPRWKVKAAASGCADCAACEAGAPPKILARNHAPPTTRQADIDTGVSCPECGTRVYKRRFPQPGQPLFACTGQGHEFTGPDLMEHIRLSVEGLTKLVQ